MRTASFKTIGLLVILFTVLLCGCQKKTDWTVTLGSKDKRPYGAYIAGKAIEKLFPGGKVLPLSDKFRYTSIDSKMDYPDGDSVSMLLLTGLRFQIDGNELERIVRFAERGNEVVLFCSAADPVLEKRFKIQKENEMDEFDVPNWSSTPLKVNKSRLSLIEDTTIKYGYEGRALAGSFKLLQGCNATVLGYSMGRPNVVRLAFGDGHITLHAAPLVLSNYFLLQDGNQQYLERFFSLFPANISTVYWNNYYLRTKERANIKSLMHFPQIQWAFYIMLACLLFYVLFNGKRRQRIIPVLASPVNSSVSFVETVGRLYYNKGNHANLAEKMVQQFLESVRQHYFINTNELDEQFIHQLAIKSGKDQEATAYLVRTLNVVKQKTIYIDEQYLLRIYKNIQVFAIKN